MKKSKTKKKQGQDAPLLLEPSPRELSQAELEACELEAHAAVPEDATDSEADAIYAETFHRLVEKRRRGDVGLMTYGLSFEEDDLD